MKKIVLSVMMMVMFLSTIVVNANPSPLAQKGAEIGITTGSIKSIDGQRIIVKGEGSYQEINLLVSEDTHIVKGANGQSIDFAKLKKGDKVVAYYDAAVTRSLPPQGRAVAFVVGNDEDNAIYMRVSNVENLANGDIRVLNSNGDALVTIKKNQVEDIEDINEGSEILVWYKMMTMSLPGQATSTKTVVLTEGTDIKVHLSAGIAAVKGQEFEIVKKDGKVYLPLREICEKLGYKVEWNNENKAIMIHKGPRTANVIIGSHEYAKMKMRVQLDEVPQIINGKTFVPVDFFDDVLDLEVEVLKSHI